MVIFLWARNHIEWKLLMEYIKKVLTLLAISTKQNGKDWLSGGSKGEKNWILVRFSGSADPFLRENEHNCVYNDTAEKGHTQAGPWIDCVCDFPSDEEKGGKRATADNLLFIFFKQ